MMMTMMISVELEGVTQRQTDRKKVHLTAFWKKGSPAAATATAAAHLVYFLVVVVVSKITTEEISSLC